MEGEFVLVFLPFILFHLISLGLQAAPWKDILLGSLAAVLLQLMLGLPFLLQHPHSYLSKAFEFSRIFLLKWSVNWAFLPEGVFRSKALAACLLLAHLALLLLFAQYKWCKKDGGLLRLLSQRLQGQGPPAMTTKQDSPGQADSAKRMLAVVFSGNLIGIACGGLFTSNFTAGIFTQHHCCFGMLRCFLHYVLFCLYP